MCKRKYLQLADPDNNKILQNGWDSSRSYTKTNTSRLG